LKTLSAPPLSATFEERALELTSAGRYVSRPTAARLAGMYPPSLSLLLTPASNLRPGFARSRAVHIAMRSEANAELTNPKTAVTQGSMLDMLDGGEDEVAEAEMLLSDFDTEYLAAAASEGALGRGGARTADEWASTVPREPLAAAVRSMCSAQSPEDLVLLGICADSAEAGVAALKAWVSALELPRGLLYNADKDGVARDLARYGPAYIKYNSATGAAHLGHCPGEFRGVIFTPHLQDGKFRQYGSLPLNLFEERWSSSAAGYDI
jgi:hypothetical protein